MAIKNHRAFSEGEEFINLVPLTKLALSSYKYTFSSLLQRQDGRGWENETLQWCPVILQELCYCYYCNLGTWWFWYFNFFFSMKGPGSCCWISSTGGNLMWICFAACPGAALWGAAGAQAQRAGDGMWEQMLAPTCWGFCYWPWPTIKKAGQR